MPILNQFLSQNQQITFSELSAPPEMKEFKDSDFLCEHQPTSIFSWGNLDEQQKKTIYRFLFLFTQIQAFYPRQANALDLYAEQLHESKTPTKLPWPLQGLWKQAICFESSSTLNIGPKKAKAFLKKLLHTQNQHPHLQARAFNGEPKSKRKSKKTVSKLDISAPIPYAASSALVLESKVALESSPAPTEGMETIFGLQDYAPIREDQSMLSPAAYFLDLLRIADNLTVAIQKQKTIAFRLLERRTDLYQISLNQESIDKLIPTLLIVNRALIKFLNFDSFTNSQIDPDAAIEQYFRDRATQPHLFLNPIFLPWVKIRSCFKNNKNFSYSELIESTFPKMTNNYLTGSISSAQQRLLWLGDTDISPEDLLAFQLSQATSKLLEDRYKKLNVDEKNSSSAPIANLLKQFSLSYPEWTDLIIRPQAAQIYRNASKFYVNHDGSGFPMTFTPGEDDELITQFSFEKFQRIATFTSAAQKLSWSYETLDQIIKLMPDAFDAYTIGKFPMTLLCAMASLQKRLQIDDPLILAFPFADIRLASPEMTMLDSCYFDEKFNNQAEDITLFNEDLGQRLKNLLAKLQTPDSCNLDPADLQLAIKLCAAFNLDLDALYYLAKPLFFSWGRLDAGFVFPEILFTRLQWLSIAAKSLVLSSLECLEVYGFFSRITADLPNSPSSNSETLNDYYNRLGESFFSFSASTIEAAETLYAQLEAFFEYAESLKSLNIDFSISRFLSLGIDSQQALDPALVKEVQTSLQEINTPQQGEEKLLAKEVAASNPTLQEQMINILKQSFQLNIDVLTKSFNQFFSKRPDIVKFLENDGETLSYQSLQEIYRFSDTIKKLNIPCDTRPDHLTSDGVSMLLQTISNQQTQDSPITLFVGDLIVIKRITELAVQLGDSNGNILACLKVISTENSTPEAETQALDILASFLSTNVVTLQELFSAYATSTPQTTFIGKASYFLEAYTTIRFMQKIHSNNVSMLLKHRQALEDVYAYDYTKPPSTPPTDDYYGHYSDSADVILSFFYRQLPETYRQSFGDILELSRDALLNDAISTLATPDLPLYNAEAWSDYLLQDVLVSGSEDTSIVNEGTQAIRVFLQRCRLNLETAFYLSGINADTVKEVIPESWWSWLENYRVWQANREVLLYPENYLDPQLRTDASPEYQEMMNALNSTQTLDSASVQTNFVNYLDKLQTLAQLVPVDMFLVPEDGISPQSYLIARTQEFPHQYYCRKFFGPTIGENPHKLRPFSSNNYWQKIDANIPSPFISTVYAFNRLFIFWVKTRFDTQQSIKDGEASSNVLPVFSIYYVYQKNSKTWSPQQTLIEESSYKTNLYLSSPDKFNGVSVPRGSDDYITYSLYTVQALYEPRKKLINIEYNPIDSFYAKPSFPVRIGYKSSIILNWQIKEDLSVSFVNFDQNLTFSPIAPLINYSSSLFIKVDAGLWGNYWQKYYDAKNPLGIKNGDKDPLIYYSRKPKVISMANSYVMDNHADEKKINTQIGLNILKPRIDTDIPSAGSEPKWMEMNQAVLILPQDTLFVDVINAKEAAVDSGRDFLANYSGAVYLGGLSLLVLPRTPLTLLADNIPDYKSDFSDSSFYRQAYVVTPINSDAIPSLLNLAETNSIDALYQQVTLSPSLAQPPIGPAVENNFLEQFDYMTPLYTVGTGNNEVKCDNPIDGLNPIPEANDPRRGSTSYLNLDLPPYRLDSMTSSGGDFSGALYLKDHLQGNSEKLPINYASGFASYYWELFFHLPLLLSKLHCQQKNFKEARSWIHRVYNPINPITLPAFAALKEEKVTPFLFPPLNADPTENLEQYLSDKDVLDIYHNHSFEPFRLAEVHITAFQKYVVTQYIKLLLAWGDSLFSQNTREGIASAMIQYRLADELLGPKPHPVISTTDEPIFLNILMLDTLPTPPAPPELLLVLTADIDWHLLGTDGNGNTVNGTLSDLIGTSTAPGLYPELSALNDFITHLCGNGIQGYSDVQLLQQRKPLQERALALLKTGLNIVDRTFTTAQLLHLNPNRNPSEDDDEVIIPIPGQKPAQPSYPYNYITGTYFKVPANRQLTRLWDEVADRLYKVRHGLSILGQSQQLPLLSAPISPKDLVSNKAQGGIGNAVSMLSAYRFEVLINYAKEFTSDLSALNSRLLSTLENQDASQLANLQAEYQITASAWSSNLTQMEIDALNTESKSLSIQLENAHSQVDYYNSLLKDGLNSQERDSLSLTKSSLAFMSLGVVASTVAAVAAAAPEVNAPWSVSFGGKELSAVAGFTASTSQSVAQILQTGAGLASQIGMNRRREQEWKNQLSIMNSQVEELQIRQESLNNQRQLLTERQAMQKADEAFQKKVLAFYQNRFTSLQLYHWMSNELLKHAQSAFAVAKSFAYYAEQAKNREISLLSSNPTASIVQGISWDSSNNGLTSSEVLKSALRSIEHDYVSKNNRLLISRQSISLAKDCNVTAEDFSKLATNAITTEKLTITSSESQLTSLTVDILGLSNPFQNYALRLSLSEAEASSAWGLTQMSISAGRSETGVMKMQDDTRRYLPFEGLSLDKEYKWTLEHDPIVNPKYSKVDYSKIKDVVLTFEFAHPASTQKASVRPSVASNFFTGSRRPPAASSTPPAADASSLEMKTPGV